MVANVSQREELIFLLNHAAELEHSLACSYLFASFSLKGSPDEGLSPEALTTVRGWKRTLGGVAIEEMMHLAVVNNLLTALGSAPHFDRPNFPHDCAYYMPEYQIELLPFNRDTLRHFIAIEQPEGSNLPAVIDYSRLQVVKGDLDNEIGPDPAQFDSQGDVYAAVEMGLWNLVTRLGEENVFIGPKPTPAIARFFEENGWEPVHSMESTVKALQLIVTQGEGASHSTPDSHYGRFCAIEAELLALVAADPAFEPARPVMHNPFTRTPPEAMGPVNIFDDEFAIQISDLFNECYGAMLSLLGRFFVMTQETEEEAKVLYDSSIVMMAQVLGPLGDLLTRQPAGNSHPGYNAGPSFVLRTVHALPHKDAAWRLLRERFDELAVYTQWLAEEKGEPGLLRAAKSLANVRDSLS